MAENRKPIVHQQSKTMETNIFNGPVENTQDNSSPILGTSSDAIIEGLHHGDFTTENDTSGMATPVDKEQIVNEQDQHEIVNAGADEEDETSLQQPVESPSSLSATKRADLDAADEDKEFIEEDKDEAGSASGSRSAGDV